MPLRRWSRVTRLGSFVIRRYSDPGRHFGREGTIDRYSASGFAAVLTAMTAFGNFLRRDFAIRATLDPPAIRISADGTEWTGWQASAPQHERAETSSRLRTLAKMIESGAR